MENKNSREGTLGAPKEKPEQHIGEKHPIVFEGFTQKQEKWFRSLFEESGIPSINLQTIRGNFCSDSSLITSSFRSR